GLLRAFSANFGICSAYRVELKAVAYGLDLARTLGFKTWWCKWITKLASNLSRVRNTQGASVSTSSTSAATLSSKQIGMLIEHCYREGNRVADWLANRVLNK
ncbi:hypothetical protein RDABS01_029707, partial [Bienertia sinuspersici]